MSISYKTIQKIISFIGKKVEVQDTDNYYRDPVKGILEDFEIALSGDLGSGIKLRLVLSIRVKDTYTTEVYEWDRITCEGEEFWV